MDLLRFQRAIGHATTICPNGGAIEVLIFAESFVLSPIDVNVDRIQMGYPCVDKSIEIWNESDEMLPVGEIGEIVVKSDYLSPGYWLRPDLNKEKFGVGASWQRFYKTGDLGLIDSDGLLYHCGRNTFQVKIRGFRIETDEVDNELSKHSAIKEAVVTAHRDVNDDLKLVAYVVLRSDGVLSGKDVITYLSARLPNSMIPSRVVFLDQLPLTRTRKVQRSALANPFESGLKQENKILGNHTESMIYRIWANVLGHADFGLQDEFIKIGGNSIQAMIIIGQIEKHFNYTFSFAEVMANGTIEKLAHLLSASQSN